MNDVLGGTWELAWALGSITTVYIIVISITFS